MKLIYDQFTEENFPQYEATLKKEGFVHFKNFLSTAEVESMLEALEEIEKTCLEADTKQIFGVPILYGYDLDGSRIVQRYPFTSLNHAYFQKPDLVEKLQKINRLVGEQYRLGDKEYDGVVSNHYLNHSNDLSRKKIGWHTDSGREFWSLKRPKQFYNIGIHLDDCTKIKGGLRLLLGTHQQSVLGMLFGKFHFVDHKPDKKEYCVEVKKGDMTIHDGRLWHRVAQAEVVGEESRRRVIYFPFIKGEVKEKDENSKPPIYLVLLQKANKMKGDWFQ
ncbi:MAG: phytanoyl-CoA dioxygenase [Bacteroidetes bacterium]|nr:MAG: phytanoyl-CoA dioxygenase [Bacteroidota bacterium]